MAEIRTVTTLKRKRAEIAASIKLYEKQLGGLPGRLKGSIIIMAENQVLETNVQPQERAEEHGHI
jgi:hypothetical protein